MDNLTDLNSAQQLLCDQCHRSGAIFLKSMAKWSPLDWFACSGCGHIFTRARRSDRDGVDHIAVRKDRRLTVAAGPR